MFGSAPLIDNVVLLLFYPPEILPPTLSAAYLMLPLIIFELIVGGYVGYHIYRREKKVKNF